VRVGMILANVPFPPDIRVEKEADVLSPAGHDVLLLCRGNASEPAEETVGNVEVRRHRVHPRSSFARRLDSLRFLVTLDSPSWRGAMERLVTIHGAEVLHCHDLAYARSALRAGRNVGVPVVLDFHENYPAALRLWRRRTLDRILFSGHRAESLERESVRIADRVIVVVDEARQRLIANRGEPGKIVVFGNTESVDLVPAVAPPLPETLNLVYVGGIAPHRGLETAVAAMPRILAERPDAHLTIVGDGVSLDELRKLSEDLGLEDAVTFTGRLPKAAAMEHVIASTIALVPHLRSPHTEATVPHKLFQYMAFSRPVLVSDCAPLKRIVEATQSGAVFEAGSPEDFAANTLKLAANRERLLAAGKAGRAAALTDWSLESESPALVQLYDQLQNSRT